MVSREQAKAFVEAVSGFLDVGIVGDGPQSQGIGYPKSTHVLTHLAAVMGYGKVPTVWDIERIDTEPTPPAASLAKVQAFAGYLREVADALAP